MAQGKTYAWVKALDNVHNHIRTTVAARADESVARDLEKLFNAIVYNIDYSNDKDFYSKFKNLLNNQLIQNLSNNPDLKELFSGAGTINEIGENAETGFAWIMGELVQAATDKILTEEERAAIKIGKDPSTVIVDLNKYAEIFPKKYMEYISKELQKRKAQQIDDDLWRFAYRSGKADLSTKHIEVVGTLSEPYQKLLSINASIKNYKKTMVRLEEVDVLKGYYGIVSSYRHGDNINYKNDEATLARLYRDYYVTYRLADNPTVTNHFNHMLGTYALTGMGTVSKASIENPDKRDTFVDFVFFNHHIKKHIYVFSTRKLIEQLLNKSETAAIQSNKIMGSSTARVTLSTYQALHGRSN